MRRRAKFEPDIYPGDLVKWCYEKKATKIGVVLHICPTGLRATVHWTDGQVATYSYAVRLLKVIS